MPPQVPAARRFSPQLPIPEGVLPGGAVSGALRPTDVQPPGYDVWADTAEANVTMLDDALEDDQRVKEFKGGTDMLATAQAIYRPQPGAPRAGELGAKYARKVAWRDYLDLPLITCTRFLDPSAEGALALAIGMDLDAKLNMVVSPLDAHDMRSLVRFNPVQIKTLCLSDEDGLPSPPIKCTTQSP